jgi:hypothetical protein
MEAENDAEKGEIKGRYHHVSPALSLPANMAADFNFTD